MTNENGAICALCGGKCCKAYAGAYYPADFGTEREGILTRAEELLASGRAQLDWWEGPVPKYYVRPTMLDRFRDSVFSGSWGGPCANLTPTGCSLEFADRPRGCRTLVPNSAEPGNCSAEDDDGDVSDKKGAVTAWAPYSDSLYEIGRRVQQSRS